MNRNAARRALALAAACTLVAACSTAGGKRVASGGYRTGATGAALSAAAERSPAALARAQERLRGSTSAERRAAARAAPGRRASEPVPDPLDALRGQAGAAAAARPRLEPAVYQPMGLAQRALTQQAVLAPALSGGGSPAAAAAPRSSPLTRAAPGSLLSRSQMQVLGSGLLLSVLAALAAGWGSLRRRRAPAEPAIAAPPRAADDPGPILVPDGAARAAGAQYLLPLRDEPAAAPRTSA